MSFALSHVELLRERLPKGKFAFWRVVFVDVAANRIHLFPVSAETPKSTALPKVKPLDVVCAKLAGKFEVVPDHIALPVMRAQDEEIPEDVRAERDERYKKIEPLVTVRKLELYSKSSRGKLFEEHQEKTGISNSQLRKLLVAYWTFGCNRNAMITLRSRSGGAGKPRPAGQAPRGRPNASIILLGDNGKANRNTSERDKHIFLKALITDFVDSDKNFTATHSSMLERDYPHGNGPKFSTFYAVATKIVASPGWIEAKAGAKEFRQTHGAARGRSRDITAGPGDVTDVDGTPFPQELVASWAPARAIRNPTLMISIDRASHYVTGFHDSLVPERWDCYRMCLFNAFTSKTELLNDLGLPPDSWLTGSLPGALFFDRGPAISEAAKVAICDELDVEQMWAPPGHPEGKPDVEGMIKTLQYRMMYGPGASPDSKRVRDQQRKSGAIDAAEWTPWRFRQELVRQIIHHNRFTHVPHLLTAEMKADGLTIATPESIYEWGQRKLQGDRAKRLTDERLYFGLLKRVSVATNSNGVRFRRHDYSSANLMRFHRSQLTALGKRRTCPTNVYWDPLTPARLYWRNQEGRMEILLPDRYSADLLRNQTWGDVEMDRLQRIVDAENLHADGQQFIVKSSKSMLTRRQEKQLAGAIIEKLPEARVNKKNTGAARKIEVRMQQHEERKRIAPIIERAVGVLPSIPSSTTSVSESLTPEEQDDFLRRMLED